MDVAEDAVDTVENSIDSFYTGLCYWPAWITDEKMSSGLFNLEDFVDELKSCALRHNGLVERLPP